MLVLSRRAKEKISFPDVGITIHFIRMQSGTAKVGIDAPLQVKIVRDEARPDMAAHAEEVRRELLRLPREVRHAVRNELHTITVGVHLLREQLQMGMDEDADDTFSTIRESLRRLDDNQIFKKPERRTSESVNPLLVVEDEANERELLVGLLRMKGFQVDSVANGDEAISYLAGHHTPSAILIDMRMPGACDGASAVRKIRSDEQHKEVLMFAVSGTSPQENGLETGRTGIDRWFPKPLNVDYLVEALRTESALT